MATLRSMAVALAFLMIAGGVAATSQNVKVGEVEGENRNDMAERGQKNNLDTVPRTLTLILDGYAFGTQQAIPGARGVQPCDPNKNTGCAAGVNAYGASFVASRAGVGAPAVIYPGGMEFGAWYGNWSDHNDNGLVDAFDRDINGAPNPATDFDATVAGEMLVFIEPGSHPVIDGNEAPPSTHPDFAMTPPGVNSDGSRANGAWRQAQGWPAFFYDGSLFRKLTVATVTESTLAPDGFGNPFTCGAKCLADIDEYAAVTEGPVANLYGSLGAGAIVDSLPTVGFSTLLLLDHPQCNPLADPNSPTYTCEELGPISRKVLPPVTDRRNDPKSSNYGRDYEADFEPWIDTQLQYVVWTPGAASNSLVTGPCDDADFTDLTTSTNTRQCSPPGYLSISARTGVWKDIDGNGWIGTRQNGTEFGGRNGEDPYLSGWTQDPHDYEGGKTSGEWVGYCAPGTDLPYRKYTNLYYTLTPTSPGGWGPSGVFAHYRFPTNSGVVTPQVIKTTDPQGSVSAVLADPTTLVTSSEMLSNTLTYSGHYTGTQPIRIQSYCYDPDPGRFTGQQVLFFPQGTLGISFKVTLDTPGRVTVNQAGIDVDAEVYDELVVGGWLG